MPLPLNDPNNPLYGLSKEKQCQVFVQWQDRGLTPCRLLSLSSQYTQNDITQAYRQLAFRFHPDRNPENKSAADAFKTLSSACEYLEYGLKSGMDRYNAQNTITNNSFYQVYGEQGLGQAGFTPFYFSGFPFANSSSFGTSADYPARQEKSFDDMSFLELLEQIPQFHPNAREPLPLPLPAGLIAALKRHIEADKSHLTDETDYDSIMRANITHFIVYHGHFEFLKWLIEAGADPTIKTNKTKNYYSGGPALDVSQLIAEKGNIDALRYLLKRCGAQLFYDEAESGVLNAQWWRFEHAVICEKTEVGLFLMEEAGYTNHISSQSLESFHRCILSLKSVLFRPANSHSKTPSANEQKTAITLLALLLNREDVSPDILYLGIQELLCVIEKIWLRFDDCNNYDYAIRDLLVQLIDYIHIQPGELATIYSEVKQDDELYEYEDQIDFDNPRKACILGLYRAALCYANYGILQKLHAISNLPRLRYNTRKNLLEQAFIGWRGGYPDFKTRQSIESEYTRAFSFLLGVGRFGKLEDLYAFHISLRDRDVNYWDHTLLHLACEAMWQDWALQLIEQMKTEGNNFDAIASRGDREWLPAYQHTHVPETLYHYSSLHLAIKKGLTQVAVSLIEAGADIRLKAVTDEPSSNCCFLFFGRRQRTEKTPLEMAIENKQSQVIRALQRAMLRDYIKQREEESEYLSQFSLFGYVLFSLGCINLCGLILGFGHSETAKLQKAYELRALLNTNDLDETTFENLNDDIAQEGRLGEIIQLSRYYLTEPVSLNNPLRI